MDLLQRILIVIIGAAAVMTGKVSLAPDVQDNLNSANSSVTIRFFTTTTHLQPSSLNPYAPDASTTPETVAEETSVTQLLTTVGTIVSRTTPSHHQSVVVTEGGKSFSTSLPHDDINTENVTAEEEVYSNTSMSEENNDDVLGVNITNTDVTEGSDSITNETHSTVISNTSSTVLPEVTDEIEESENQTSHDNSTYICDNPNNCTHTNESESNVNFNETDIITNQTSTSFVTISFTSSTRNTTSSPQPPRASTPTSTTRSRTTSSSQSTTSSISSTVSPHLESVVSSSVKIRNILLGVGVPVTVLAIVVISFVCYKKRKKSGRGYITLDDFGSLEGMQNPNYDGEL